MQGSALTASECWDPNSRDSQGDESAEGGWTRGLMEVYTLSAIFLLLSPSLRTSAAPSMPTGHRDSGCLVDGAWLINTPFFLSSLLDLTQKPLVSLALGFPLRQPAAHDPNLHGLLLLPPFFLQQAALLLGQNFNETFTHHRAHFTLLPRAGPAIFNDGT